nr:uncharacterized protein LOC124817163 [Hydra vulgaris]
MDADQATAKFQQKVTCVVRWMDNGAVTLTSSFIGIEEMGTVRRWSESKKEYIQVNRPNCVKVYNENMVGSGFLIALYRIKAKTKKWPVRMIFHFVDFALVNSWLEYQDIKIQNGTPKRQTLDLLNFRNEIAATLVKAHLTTPIACRPVGRPRITTTAPITDSGDSSTSTSSVVTPPPKRARPAERPAVEIRYDLFDHFPVCIKELGQRCKFEDAMVAAESNASNAICFFVALETKFQLFHMK